MEDNTKKREIKRRFKEQMSKRGKNKEQHNKKYEHTIQ
jgi:hypothetical protein